VHPDAIRQGVGTSLLQHALTCAQREHPGPVKVIATLNAQPFYARHGFTETQRYTLGRGDVAFPVVEMEFSPATE